jgi:hypothetical protein
MPKQEIKLKVQSEKQKLIWRNKLHKMLKAIELGHKNVKLLPSIFSF